MHHDRVDIAGSSEDLRYEMLLSKRQLGILFRIVVKPAHSFGTTKDLHELASMKGIILPPCPRDSFLTKGFGSWT